MSTLRSLLRHRKTLAGLTVLAVFVLLALLAPALAPGDPSRFVGRPNLPPSTTHLLGTTGQGQDVFHELVWGSRVSLTVAVLVGVLTTVFAAGMAMLSAYFGGRLDETLSLLVNVFLTIPGLPLMVVLAVFLPPGAVTIVFVLSVTGWAWGARYLRSQALSMRQRDYAWAAIATGERAWRVMFIEILPNMGSVLIAYLINQIIFAIGAEAGLEFLGLGNASQVTWGTMLYWAANNSGLLLGAWWTFVAPGTAIALVAFSLAMVNYAMDETTNPRLRTVRRLALLLRRLPRRERRSRATAVVRDAAL